MNTDLCVWFVVTLLIAYQICKAITPPADDLVEQVDEDPETRMRRELGR